MTTFSAADAALSGFRFARAKPRTVAIWGVVQLVFGLVFTALTIALIGPFMVQAEAAGSLSQAEALQGAGKVLAFYAVCIPVVLFYFAVFTAAANRALATPEDDRLAYLRLGRDEVRQVLLMLLSFAALFGAELVLLIPIALVVAIAAFAAKALTGLVAVILALVFMIGVAVAMVRLSLASPMTFDRRRVTLLGSWKLTRGHFWKMVAAYLLSFVLLIVVSVLVYVIAFAAAALLGAGTDWKAFLGRSDFNSLSAYFTVPRLAFMLINAVGGALTLPVMLMPQIEIYRRLRDEAAV